VAAARLQLVIIIIITCTDPTSYKFLQHITISVASIITSAEKVIVCLCLSVMEYWHHRADKRLGNLPQDNQAP